LRAKGFFWLASRPDEAGYWSQAGQLLSVEYAGPWSGGSMQESSADIDSSASHPSGSDDDEEILDAGSPRQELVLVGANVDREAICAALDACLLTHAEFAAGYASWQEMNDDFPEW
jgi:G3E family GTPase